MGLDVIAFVDRTREVDRVILITMDAENLLRAVGRICPI